MSLISLAVFSQISALRDEITTLAPAMARPSANARPMPIDEPVVSATFPVRSNRSVRFDIVKLSLLFSG